MNIDWTTVIFEVINFALLMLIMARFVFRPVAETLDKRKEEIAARTRETSEREAEAAATRARFEAELANIDALAEARIAEALRAARGDAEGIVAAARAKARGEVDKAEVELAGARRRTLERFRGEIYRLGTDAARRIVRDLGAPEIDLAFARRAAHALIDAVGGGGPRGPVEVSHGPDADPKVLRELLQAEFGPGVQLELERVPELVGGVRLQAGSHIVDANVGASLDAWYESLARNGEGLATPS